MRRNERMNEAFFGGVENSTVDPNRFYSILLDARAASVSENMCDIAEKLLAGEKENAKAALEHLWHLKKNLFSKKNGTVDLLINHYQEKVELLEAKEERLRKVGLDSRSLLEEKRKKDEETATVKQLAADCTRELSELSEKLEKLRTKEQELELIGHQISEELSRNENEIVNGLYEIILPSQAVASSDKEPPPHAPEPLAQDGSPLDEVLPAQPYTAGKTAIFEPPIVADLRDSGRITSAQEAASDENDADQAGAAQYAQEKTGALFPKSVVKTAAGKVIGEYYYDKKAYKNERHYIFSSAFFAGELLRCVKRLKGQFDTAVHADMVQMINDASKRIGGSKRLHFEVATSEILNERTIARLWQNAKLRSIGEVERFGERLQAKLDSLGPDYSDILMEQMRRCSVKS